MASPEIPSNEHIDRRTFAAHLASDIELYRLPWDRGRHIMHTITANYLNGGSPINISFFDIANSEEAETDTRTLGTTALRRIYLEEHGKKPLYLLVGEPPVEVKRLLANRINSGQQEVLGEAAGGFDPRVDQYSVYLLAVSDVNGNLQSDPFVFTRVTYQIKTEDHQQLHALHKGHHHRPVGGQDQTSTEVSCVAYFRHRFSPALGIEYR